MSGWPQCCREQPRPLLLLSQLILITPHSPKGALWWFPTLLLSWEHPELSLSLQQGSPHPWGGEFTILVLPIHSTASGSVHGEWGELQHHPGLGV